MEGGLKKIGTILVVFTLLSLAPIVPAVGAYHPVYDLRVKVTGGTFPVLLTVYDANTFAVVAKEVVNSTAYLNLPAGVYYFYAVPLNSDVEVFPQSGYIVVPLGSIRLYEVYIPQFAKQGRSLQVASLNIDYVTAMDVYYAGTFNYIALGTNASGLIVAKYFYQNSSFVVAWERGGLGGNITAVAITGEYTAAAVYSDNSTKIYVFYTDNGSLITVVNQTETVQHHGCILPPNGANSTSSPYSSIPLLHSIAIVDDQIYAILPSLTEMVVANISPTTHVASVVLARSATSNPFVGLGISNSFAVAPNDTAYAVYVELLYPSSLLKVFTAPNLNLSLEYNLSKIIYPFLSTFSIVNSAFTINSEGQVFVVVKNVTITLNSSASNSETTYFLVELIPNGSTAVKLPPSKVAPLVTPSSNGVVVYVDGELYDINLAGQIVWSKAVADVRAITSSPDGKVIAVLAGGGLNWTLLEFNTQGQLIAEVKEVGQTVYPMAQLGIGINGGQDYPLTMDPYDEVIFLSTSTYLYGIPVGINATLTNGRVIAPVTVDISEVPPYSGVVKVTYNGKTITTTSNISIRVLPGPITLYAVPYSNSTFQYWSVNGSVYTENPLTVEVLGNTEVTAVFRSQLNVTFEALGLTDTYWFINVSGKLYTTSSPSISLPLRPGVSYTAGLLTFNNQTVTVFRGVVNSSLIVLNFTGYFRPMISCLDLASQVFSVAGEVLTKGYWYNFSTNYGQSIYYYALLMNESYRLFNDSPQFYSYLQMVVDNPVMPYYTGDVNVQAFVSNASQLLSYNVSAIAQMLNEEAGALSRGDYRAFTEIRALTDQNLTDLVGLLNRYGSAGAYILDPSNVQTLVPYLAFRNSLIALSNVSALLLKEPVELNMTTVSWLPTVLDAEIQGENLVAQLYVPPYYSFDGVAQVEQFYSIPVSGLYYNMTTSREDVQVGNVQVPLNLTVPYSRLVGFKVAFVNATIINPAVTEALESHRVISVLNLSEYDYYFQGFVGKVVTTVVNVTPKPVKVPFVIISLNSSSLGIAQLYLNTTPSVVMYNYIVTEVRGAEYLRTLDRVYFIVPNFTNGYVVAGSPQRVNFSVLNIPYNTSFDGTLQRSIAFLELNNSYVGYATQTRVNLNSQFNISYLAIKSSSAHFVFFLDNISQVQIVGAPLGKYTIEANTTQGAVNTTVSIDNYYQVVNVSLTVHTVVTASPIVNSTEGLPVLKVSVVAVLVVALAVVLYLLRRK